MFKLDEYLDLVKGLLFNGLYNFGFIEGNIFVNLLFLIWMVIIVDFIFKSFICFLLNLEIKNNIFMLLFIGN